MARIDDPAYLRTEQYRTAENLDARMQFHARFSTRINPWHSWVFDRLRLPRECRVLEIGCGAGTLWRENAPRLVEGWDILLSDLSPGMLERARQNLREATPSFRFSAANAQALPFPDTAFDAVIANHMLYHVPDRPQALAEIRRVLLPGGRLFASAGSQAHSREITRLAQRFDPSLTLWEGRGPGSFTLETGHTELAPWFSEIVVHRYVDILLVDEAGPLVAYVASFTPMPDERRAAFSRFVAAELERQEGALRIPKENGLFEAVRC